MLRNIGRHGRQISGAYQTEQCRILSIAALAKAPPKLDEKGAPTVFFLARSPEAPRTTIVVFSLSSMVLSIVTVSKSNLESE